MAGQHVELLERAGVEQMLDPLAGGHLAAGVLALDGLLGAGVAGRVLPLGQLLDALGHRVVRHGQDDTGGLDTRGRGAFPPAGKLETGADHRAARVEGQVAVLGIDAAGNQREVAEGV